MNLHVRELSSELNLYLREVSQSKAPITQHLVEIPFNSDLDGIESTKVQSAATNQTSEDVEGSSGKKRKQSQMAARLGDYIGFRKDQIEKTMNELNEKKKCEDDCSVQKCIDIVDAIEELTDEQRQIAMSYSNLK